VVYFHSVIDSIAYVVQCLSKLVALVKGLGILFCLRVIQDLLQFLRKLLGLVVRLDACH
jgi:hypothetical protein